MNNTPTEMIEFMGEIKGAVEKLVGKDGKVAMLGDADNGIFCLLISLSSTPHLLIMANVMTSLAHMLHNEMAASYQQAAQMGPTPDKVM